MRTFVLCVIRGKVAWESERIVIGAVQAKSIDEAAQAVGGEYESWIGEVYTTTYTGVAEFLPGLENLVENLSEKRWQFGEVRYKGTPPLPEDCLLMLYEVPSIKASTKPATLPERPLPRGHDFDKSS